MRGTMVVTGCNGTWHKHVEDFEFLSNLRTRQGRGRNHPLLGHQTFYVVMVGVATVATLSRVGDIARAFQWLDGKWLHLQSIRASEWGQVVRVVH